jgi:hypothetical protein
VSPASRRAAAFAAAESHFREIVSGAECALAWLCSLGDAIQLFEHRAIATSLRQYLPGLATWTYLSPFLADPARDPHATYVTLDWETYFPAVAP